MQGDGNDCLTLLFKYPQVDNLVELIGIGERVKKAICDKLNGKTIRLADVFPNALSKIDNQSKKSLQDGNQYAVSSSYSLSQAQSQTQSQNQNPSYTSNYNPIHTAKNQGMTQFQSDSNLEPEQNQMKSLLNNAWSSVGGFVTDIKSQVTKQIEKVITDDRFNLRQPQSQSQSQSTSYPVNITNPGEAIKILERLYAKYQNKMDQSDQADFAAAIEYFKNKY